MDFELIRDTFKEFIIEFLKEASQAKDLNELQRLCSRAEVFFGMQEDSIRYFLEEENLIKAQNFRPFDQEEL